VRLRLSPSGRDALWGGRMQWGAAGEVF
jgi:hypothetical protein